MLFLDAALPDHGAVLDSSSKRPPAHHPLEALPPLRCTSRHTVRRLKRKLRATCLACFERQMLRTRAWSAAQNSLWED